MSRTETTTPEFVAPEVVVPQGPAFYEALPETVKGGIVDKPSGWLTVRMYATGETRICKNTSSRYELPLQSLGFRKQRVPSGVYIKARRARASGALDYSAELQDSVVKPLYEGCRPTKFTKLGKQTLREFGTVVEEQCQNNAIFLTGTIPGSTWEAAITVAAYSAKIVQWFSQWVRDNCENSYCAWVWERQRRGFLHLHAVIASTHVTGLDTISSKFSDAWRGWLHRVRRLSGVNVFLNSHKHVSWLYAIQTRVERCSKSITRYLAKYLSKERSKHELSSLNDTFPSRWWRVCNRSLALIKPRRVTLDIVGLNEEQADNALSHLVEICSQCSSSTFVYSQRYSPEAHTVILYPKTDESNKLRIRLYGALCNVHAFLEADCRPAFDYYDYRNEAEPGGAASSSWIPPSPG